MKTSLTLEQKLKAMAFKYYSGIQWVPQAGDYYTSSRDDLELYRIELIDRGVVYTRYCDRECEIAQWPENEFITEGFGLNRVHVPRHIFIV